LSEKFIVVAREREERCPNEDNTVGKHEIVLEGYISKIDVACGNPQR
jgi:hypothetical protein